MIIRTFIQLILLLAIVVTTVMAVFETQNALAEDRSDKKLAWITGTQQEKADTKNPLLVMIQGLGACLGLFFIGLALYQRTRQVGKNTQQKRLVIRERVALSQKSSLVIVECDGKSYLCSVGTDTVSVVSESGITKARPELIHSEEGVCRETLQKRSA
jgi:flagellar biogenesis protein FliO